MENYNGFKSIIQDIITEKEMVEPAPEKFIKFIAENDLQKREIEKEVANIAFKVTAYYINSELKKVEIIRNGTEIYRGHAGTTQFPAYVSQISKQLEITL